MKRAFSGIAGIFAALAMLAPMSVSAQVTTKVVTTCGTQSYTAGKMQYPTQDTTGAACGNAAGGGGGVAGFTAAATCTAVLAGTNKPASEGLFGNVCFTPTTPTGTFVDLSLPSGVFGLDGSTIMSTSNPFAVQITAGAAVIGHVINDASSAVIGHVINDAGSAIIGSVSINQTTPGTTNAVAIKDTNNVAPDFTLTSPIGVVGPYPGKNTAGVFSNATPETCSSGNVANATVACTLATASAKTTYISGFAMTADGATVGLAVSCTLTGTITGTMTFTFSYPAGAVVAGVPLIVQFSPAIPASTTNTTIVASCPASGTGGTNASMNAWGSLL